MKPKYKLRSLMQDSLQLNKRAGFGMPQQFVYTLRDFLINNEGAPGITVDFLSKPCFVEYKQPLCLSRSAEPNIFTHLVDSIRFTEFPAWKTLTIESPDFYSDLLLFTTPDHNQLFLENIKYTEKTLQEIGSKALKKYPLKKVPGNAFLAFDQWASQYYYHWVIDTLPRFMALEQMNFDGVILLPHGVHDYMKEALALIGVNSSKYTFLELDRKCRYQFDSLVYVQKRSHRNSTHPEAVKLLKAAVDQHLPDSKKEGYEYIYIPRNKAKTRLLANEAELIRGLEPLGFKAVYCEDLSMDEKQAIFQQAKVVIAPHSSGTTNILFCQPGMTLIEIVPENFITEAYLAMSMHLNFDHYYDIAPVVDDDITINVDKFIEKIKPVINRCS